MSEIVGMTDEGATRAVKAFTEDGGVFNVRFSDGKWQAQGVKGSSAATGSGETLAEAVQIVLDAHGFDWKTVVS